MMPDRHTDGITLCTTSDGAGGSAWFALALFSISVAVAINWIAFVPPLQDFNDWVYQGFLIKLAMAGSTIPDLIKHWPVPYVTSQFILAGLCWLFTPLVAAKVFATIYLIGSALLARFMVLTSHESDRNIKYFLLVCVVIINSAYWTGEINYQIGLILVLLYIQTQPADKAPNLLFDAIYTVLLFCSHAVCLGIVLIYMGWRAIYQRRIIGGFISIIPVLILIAWYVLADPRKDDISAMLTPELSGLREILI